MAVCSVRKGLNHEIELECALSRFPWLQAAVSWAGNPGATGPRALRPSPLSRARGENGVTLVASTLR